MKGHPIVIFILVLLVIYVFCEDYEGKVVKGNKNHLYLVENGQKRLFPDFYTFTKRGFTSNSVIKIEDNTLNGIPLGDPVPSIPVFRPEDYMYHTQCEDPERMVRR